MSTSYSSDSPAEHNQDQLLASKGRGAEAAQRMAELFSQEMKLQNLLNKRSTLRWRRPMRKMDRFYSPTRTPAH